MKVLITGSNGFVGKNLVENLKYNENIELYLFDKDNSKDDLARFTKDCDIVVNLAGINRTINNNDFITGNFGVISDVVENLKKNNNLVPIIYSSSIQAQLDNDYGKSKKLAEDFLFKYSQENKVDVFIYRFPNLFGKWSKPNYNTVIATFCYNIANDLPIMVNNRETILNLVYIDDVVKELIKAINLQANKKEDDFCYVEPVYQKKLGEIADLIYKFKENRNSLNVINTSDLFEKKLYSTYLSFLPNQKFCYDILSHKDNRGSFTELFRTSNAGQFSVNIAKPGITKGNHWHNTKNEKFIVVKGNAEIKFRNPFSNETYTVFANGDNIQIVDIPCGYTHNITNVGKDDMIFFIWCNENFDPNNPDTFFLEV